MRYQQHHEKIVDICLTAATYSEVEARLGISTPSGSLRRYLKQNNIPMPQYQGQKAAVRLSLPSRVNLLSDDDLCANSRAATCAIKRYLLRSGQKEQRCEQCGWSVKRSDGKCPVNLHHKNGDSGDNRLENLQMLCPNCHSLTDNYAGKNKSNPRRRALHEAKAEYFAEPRHVCKTCGKLGYGMTYCSNECSHLVQRKTKWPSKEVLQEEIAIFSWTALGKKYNVSDSAVRKWARRYGLLEK